MSHLKHFAFFMIINQQRSAVVAAILDIGHVDVLESFFLHSISLAELIVLYHLNLSLFASVVSLFSPFLHHLHAQELKSKRGISSRTLMVALISCKNRFRLLTSAKRLVQKRVFFSTGWVSGSLLQTRSLCRHATLLAT